MALSVAGPDLPYGEVGRVAVDRLLDVLPDPVRVGVDELRRKVRTAADLDNPSDVRIRRTLEQGVQQSRVVRLEYTDGAGVTTSRDVDPVGFLERDAAWFLIAWCHLREAGRMFRFQRIAKARLTRRQTAEHDVDDLLGWVPFDPEMP